MVMLDLTLAERESEWAAAVLACDWDALTFLAREPLPWDAPIDTRERWAGRRDVLAVMVPAEGGGG